MAFLIPNANLENDRLRLEKKLLQDEINKLKSEKKVLQDENDKLKSSSNLKLSGSEVLQRLGISADVVIVASDDAGGADIHAHKVVLAGKSPVFKAMLLQSETEESGTGMIKISNVSHNALLYFIEYLYSGEDLPSWNADEKLTCELLELAEKYQVKQIKFYCENLLATRLNTSNMLKMYALSVRHNAKKLKEKSISLIVENPVKVRKQVEYQELVKSDPEVIVAVLEACLDKQVQIGFGVEEIE